MEKKNEIIGYPIDVGYIGFVDGKKMLFETEDAYEEYMESKEAATEEI